MVLEGSSLNGLKTLDEMQQVHHRGTCDLALVAHSWRKHFFFISVGSIED